MASNPKRAVSSWERTKAKRDRGVFEKSNFAQAMEGYAARGADPAAAYD